jgi:hypothetical protein
MLHKVRGDKNINSANVWIGERERENSRGKALNKSLKLTLVGSALPPLWVSPTCTRVLHKEKVLPNFSFLLKLKSSNYLN